MISALESNSTLVEMFHQSSYIGEALFKRMNQIFERNKSFVKPAVVWSTHFVPNNRMQQLAKTMLLKQETLVTGTHKELGKDSPMAMLRDVPLLVEYISKLALPEWHPLYIADQECTV